MWKSFVLELHGESFDLAGECIDLISPVEVWTAATMPPVSKHWQPSCDRSFGPLRNPSMETSM
jgi:hypothetical protein